MESVVTTDDVLMSIKPFGKIQTLFVMSGAYMYFFMPMNGQSVNFIAAIPDHHCTPRDGYSVNHSVPYTTDEHGVLVYAQCEEWTDPEYQNGTQDCQDGWVYDDTYYDNTIITEWDLVCGQNSAAAEISQSVLMIGGLFGAFFFGGLADRYGRRPTFLFALILYDVSGLILCFSTNYAMFIVFRFLIGFSQTAFWVPLSSNLSEYMIPKYRSWAMTVPSISLPFGLMFMSLLAFLTRDWRYLQIGITSPTIVATIAFWFLPESLRWLMSRGKDDQVEHLVRRLSKINGIELPPQGESYDVSYDITTQNGQQVYITSNGDNTNQSKCEYEKDNRTGHMNGHTHEFTEIAQSKGADESVGEVENSDASGTEGAELAVTCDTLEKQSLPESGDKKRPSRKSYLDLFKPPVLHVTTVLCILRFSHTLVYFGFALSTGRLAGDPYLNFFYSALVELPARIMAPFVYKKVRRTYLLSFLFGACCADLIALMLIPLETKNHTDLAPLRTTLSLLGKFFITMTLSGHMLLIMELFPTDMRNMGNGWTLCVGRVGAIIAPFMLYLDSTFEHFSASVMAAFSLLTACIILTLPDTRKTKQPQSIDELREIMRSRKNKEGEKQVEKENTEKSGVENEGYDEG